MWRHPLLKVILLIYIGWGAWNWYSDRPFHQPDGILAADDPQLRAIDISQSNRFYYWRTSAREPLSNWWTACATTACGSRPRWYAATPEPARAKYYW
jgi:hypothetical protein